MRTKLISIFLFFYCISATSQNFMDGYVIVQPNDTLFGKIELLGDKTMSKKCVFKQEDGTLKTFLPSDILGYRISNNKYFITENLDGEKVFFEFLIKGKLDVYYVNGENNKERYFIKKEGEALRELEYEEIEKYENGIRYKYDSKKHIGELKYLMKDAPQLQNQINAMKKLQHQNLIKLAENYHKIVCDDEKCIIFEQKNRIKWGAEVHAGITNYRYDFGNEVNTKKTLMEYSMLGYIWLPRNGDNIFFKTGIITGKYHETRKKYYRENPVEYSERILKIPLLFEYQFNRNKTIQPKISSGIIYIQSHTMVTVPLLASANINLTNNLYWSANCGVDFYIGSKSLISLFSLSANTGIGFTF